MSGKRRAVVDVHAIRARVDVALREGRKLLCVFDEGDAWLSGDDLREAWEGYYQSEPFSVVSWQAPTIEELAREYVAQPHEIRATLGLGDAHDDQTPIDRFDGWTEDKAYDVLWQARRAA